MSNPEKALLSARLKADATALFTAADRQQWMDMIPEEQIEELRLRGHLLLHAMDEILALKKLLLQAASFTRHPDYDWDMGFERDVDHATMELRDK